MIKKIVKVVVVIMIVSYACWSLAYAKEVVLKRPCNHITLTISDDGRTRLIESKEVLESVKNNPVVPLHKTISQVDLLGLENLILTNNMIKSACCYHTTSGNVHIELKQISPILRIVLGNQSWFLDEDGKLIELERIYPYKVQIASGNIDYKYVKELLYPFARQLYSDPFWRTQIQQIVITDKRECILIPLIGDFHIEIGRLTEVDQKLNRLRTFLQTVPQEVGWNYYSSVNIKNNNQIVCKRRVK